MRLGRRNAYERSSRSGGSSRAYRDTVSDMPRRETVGARIKRLREGAGLSQRDLAEPGVSYAYISRVEAGQRRPSEKALRKLAAKLGVTPLELETGNAGAPCPHCGRVAR